MKKFWKYFWGILVTTILLAIGTQLVLLIPSPQKVLRENDLRQDIHYSNIPTLLINGYGGSNYTYNKMITYYQDQNIAQKTMTIHVTPTGKVHVSGSVKNKKNALIQLLFDWNLTKTYDSQTNWTIKVIKILHDHYGVKELNVIGHSWGGSEILHAIGQSKWLQHNIKFNKIILMGAVVNGGVNNKISYQEAVKKDITNAEYRKLRAQFKKLDPCSKIHFYNVMGDYKDNTDESVPNDQSEFLNQILNPQWSTCQTKIFKGLKHSQLHQDTKVLMYVAHLLYD